MAMVDETGTDLQAPDTPRVRKRAARSSLSRKVKRLGRRLLRNSFFTAAAGGLIKAALVVIHRTQKPVAGSSDFAKILTDEHPAIVALWHGQHLLAPFFRPKTLPYVALLSKNADAEVNAAVVRSFGIHTLRGSGGRVRQATPEKGGARALISMVRMLAKGYGVCMIADVPKGVPREAGLGIVTLARLSGRPIVPAAAVTSRRHVVERSWDKTTLPLPFGRMAVVLGTPIFVPRDADEALIEATRRNVTLAIEAANTQALRLVEENAP